MCERQISKVTVSYRDARRGPVDFPNVRDVRVRGSAIIIVCETRTTTIPLDLVHEVVAHHPVGR